MIKEYYVYIMTNKSRTLYTGVTNNLMRRVYEHKNKLVPGFTCKYNIQYLVCVACHSEWSGRTRSADREYAVDN